MLLNTPAGCGAVEADQLGLQLELTAIEGGNISLVAKNHRLGARRRARSGVTRLDPLADEVAAVRAR